MAAKKLTRAPARKRAQDEPKSGRPPIYDYTFPKRAYRACLLGATIDDLAELFGVSTSAIDKWTRIHPDFADQCRLGRTEADARVAEALFKRALGYTHPEERIFSHPETKFSDAAVVRVRTRKHYPPDTNAAIHWLAVRRKVKGEWQLPRSSTEHGGIPPGAGGVPIGMRDETKGELIASILNMIHPKPDPA